MCGFRSLLALALLVPWCDAHAALASQEWHQKDVSAIVHAAMVHLIVQAGARRVHQHNPGAGVVPLQDLRHPSDGTASARASHKCVQSACCLGYNF